MNDWFVSICSQFGLKIYKSEIYDNKRANLYSVQQTIDLGAVSRALAIAETIGLESVTLHFNEEIVTIDSVDFKEYIQGNLSKVDFLSKWKYGSESYNR